ncbi:MAG: glycosyltransferase family 4 protein [Acidobacteriia bacterium]|nr:glycosyltransferase family 4 protein [Terriglobia bacterium]
MRLAWFAPLPPIRSGIATYNAELLPLLDGDFLIDRFVERSAGTGVGVSNRPTPVPAHAGARVHDAHDFLWMQRREPYDLVVYQLGNSPAHDYMWAYLAPFPGLVVVHDPTLHHARARQLLSRGRADDYRREFHHNHPDAPIEFAEYVVQGLGGTIYYFYSMLRVAMRTARLVAVHNPRVAGDLRDAFPGVAIEAIHLGTPALDTGPALRARVRATMGVPDGCTLFAAFGKITEAKRITAILRAFSSLVRDGVDARLLLAGDASDYPSLDAEIEATGAADRIFVTGYIEDDNVGGYLAAADACLCLRWPTTGETSASWLHGLAAGRPTVISDLAHLVDIPSSVTLRVDLLDEEASLLDAMRRLATDSNLRATLARAGHDYWAAHHTLDAMADDYRRIVTQAAARPATAATDLPSHFLEDYSGLARGIMKRLEVKTDLQL